MQAEIAVIYIAKPLFLNRGAECILQHGFKIKVQRDCNFYKTKPAHNSFLLFENFARLMIAQNKMYLPGFKLLLCKKNI